MGQATYYLKAKYADAAHAKKAFPAIFAFLAEGEQAAHFWQDNRDEMPDVFWPQFKTQYPIIYEYLGDLAEGDCNNTLAGELDFLEDEDLDTLDIVDDAPEVVQFCGYIWHFADWSRIAQWIRTHTDAIDVKWLSDEHVNYFDCLHF